MARTARDALRRARSGASARSPRGAMVAEGCTAGLAFAVADAVAAGPWRTPPAILFLVLGTALAGGFAVGLLVPRRRGLAAAVVLFGVAAVNGLSLVTKQLGAEGEAVRGACLAVTALAAFALVVLPAARERGTRASRPPAPSAATAPGGAPDVVLVIVDTLRADAVNELLSGRRTNRPSAASRARACASTRRSARRRGRSRRSRRS